MDSTPSRSRVSRRGLTHALALCLAAVALQVPAAGPAFAWPDRPVKLVVPVAAGGPTDDLARILANGLSETLGASFFVENRGGGGGRIGNGAVARAEPDGYTLLVAAPTLTISAALSPTTTSYDPEKDFAPIAIVATTPAAISVAASLGAADIKSLIAMSTREGAVLNYASAGTGTVSHLSAELLKIRSGLRMAHVPHIGSGPALQSLMSGSVQVLATPAPAIQSQVQAGAIKALAVTGPRRWKALPSTPTMLELGFKDFVAVSAFGLLAPAATPKAIVDKLSAETLRLLLKPETIERLEKLGYEPGLDAAEIGSAAYAKRISSDLTLWRDIARQAGIALKK